MKLRVFKIDNKNTTKSGDFKIVYLKKQAKGLAGMNMFGGSAYMMFMSVEDYETHKVEIGKVFEEDEDAWELDEEHNMFKPI